MGSLVVVARSAADAARIFDEYCEARPEDETYVRDMSGRRIDVEELRAEPPLD
jgi:hypothetical protein